MTRYEKINDYYIEDKYTGKKLTLTEIEKLLNNYEETLQNQRRNLLCQIY